MYTLVQHSVFINRCRLKHIFKLEIKTFRAFFKSNIIEVNLKMAPKKSGYYAVRVGKTPGVYSNWAECELQVKGFSGAVYKKFPTLVMAQNFINGDSTPQQPVVNQAINDRQQKNVSNTIDSEMIGLSASDFINDWSFDEGVVPVITSATDMLISVPKITYPAPKKESYYAVHRGKKPGVYRTWTDCSEQIKDYRNASYRKFENQEEAEEYVRTGGIKKATKRELRDLEISNKVIKKRRTGDSKCEYTLRNCDEPVVVFTDGASSENGKRRSRAGIGVYWGDNHPLNASKRITGRQTNNRAEIYAAVHALHQAKQIGAKKVQLYTDSQFVIHAITDWINKWKKNGWKLVTGQEVANKEDIIALDLARTGLDVEWIYVKAHNRNKGNDEADRLAVAGRELILKPENCSEFQSLTKEENESSSSPFLLTSASTSAEDVLPLVLPDIQEKKKPYYAVHRGKNPGVYSTWTECERQIRDFVNASFRKFFSEVEAKEFVRSGKVVPETIVVPQCGEDDFVTVFTDGASSANGSEDAKAGIGVYWGPGNPLNTSMRLFGRQTNNRAEIHAAVHALKQAKRLGIKNIRLYTDSKFVINGITLWIHKWKENNWKTASGQPVTNKDDFIVLEQACKGLNVDWCYVKAHDNNVGNDEADKLAVAGCNKPLSDTIILT